MYLRVYVTPSARRERVTELDDALAIAVREPAAGSAANARVRQIVADRLGVPYAQVRILTGHHSRGKLLVVTQ